jgi:GGDEF domain-containing protein
MIGDKIVGWIRQALLEHEPTIDPAAKHAEVIVPSATAGTASISGQEVEQRLRAMMAKDGAMTGGSLHLVGLSDLKSKLGDRWARLEDRVHSVAQKAILRHLGPRDVFFRFDDTLYVLVFADMAPEQARLIAAAITQEIYRTLLGEADLASLTVRSAVTRLDGSTVMESRSIAALLADALLANEHGHTMQQPSDATPSGTRRESSPPLKPKIEIRYRPVWDIRRQVLSTYLCIPTARVFGSTPACGYDVLEGSRDADSILSLDLQALREAVETLDELYRNLFRFILVVPLHVETLAQPTRRRIYADHLRSIPEYIRGLTQISLHGLPAGTPYSRLAEFVAVLRPFVRGVFVDVGIDWGDYRVLTEAGIRVVSTTWPRGRGKQQAAELLAHFRADSAHVHLRMFLDGVPDQMAARMVRAAGVDFIAGPAIAADLAAPQHMLRFTWDDLVSADGESAPKRRRRVARSEPGA